MAEIYTDNIDLTASGNKDHEFATEIKPTLELTNKSARLDASIKYAVQALYFARESDRNSTFQQLDSEATLNLIPNSLDLLASANISQQVVDSSKPVGFDAVSTSENIDDVNTLSIGPRLKYRLGNNTDGVIYISNEYTRYDGNANVDSDARNLELSLTGESSTEKMRWTVRADSRTVEFEDNRDEETISTSSLELNYRFSSRWGMDASAGYEDYELNNTLSDSESYGQTWTAGLTWNPTVRTTVKASAGEQFFGKTESFSVNQKSRRITFEVGRSESLESLEELQFSDSESIDFTSPANQTLLPDEVGIFISERYYANIAYRFPRSNLSLYVFEEDRTFDTSGGEESTNGGTLSYSLTLGSRTSISANYTLNETEELTGDTDRLRQLFIVGNKQFSKKLSSSLTLSRLIRDGDLNIYNANLVRLDVTMSF